MEIVHSLPEQLWRGFVENHPEGNIFHTPEMFRVFQLTKGYIPELWAAIENQQVLALLLPVQITLMGGYLSRVTTRSVSFGGVLYTYDEKGQTALGTLLQFYTQEKHGKILFSEFRNQYDMDASRTIFRENGFAYEDHLSYLIDLQRPIEGIYQGFSKSARKAIKRSMRRGVISVEIQERSLIPEFYTLLKKTFTRAGVPLVDISLFNSVFDILVSKEMAKMFLAQVDGRYVAASLELPFKENIYSWFSGYDYHFRDTYPNDLLVWNILEWGSKNGFHSFNFGGAGRPEKDYGPRNFKEKFGGYFANYGRFVCVHDPATLMISSIGYDFYRKIIKSRAIWDRSHPVESSSMGAPKL